MKVLRAGDAAVPWPAIEVVPRRRRRPELSCTDRPPSWPPPRGLTAFALSLTHEDGYAAAVVVADMSDPRIKVRRAEHR